MMGAFMFALMGILIGIVVITGLELIRCLCPKFRKWIGGDGGDWEW